MFGPCMFACKAMFSEQTVSRLLVQFNTICLSSHQLDLVDIATRKIIMAHFFAKQDYSVARVISEAILLICLVRWTWQPFIIYLCTRALMQPLCSALAQLRREGRVSGDDTS